ncbi:MAG TPA: right-handed parallel beta-helix repeat-containing protein, partial [Planctomycetota bacterium]|nr:right-handed parallel beta-helix repeat-containing protein [Planctomycetota bacterium]
RRPRARHPNDGYLRVEKVGPDRRTSFTYRAGDLEAYGKVEHIELVFLHDWSISRVGLRSIDTESRTVTLRDPVGPASRHFAMDWFEPDPRYFLEGSPSFLDRPGEWVLDVEKKELLYRPVPGESPSGIRAIAPATEALVVVRGDEATGKPVRGLAFVGLTFEHCAFPLPPHGYAAGQAGFHEERVVPGGGALRRPMPAALTFEIAEDCRFERGRIERCGGSALRFGSRARRNVIASSVIRDVGGNGIMIGEEQTRHIDGQPWWRAAPDQVASENVVIDCLIERCGAQFYGAVGVWVGLAEKTRIAQNEIRHLPYTGVSVGWMWSTTPTPCRENVVERNHIHHVMQILSDGGGIYTLGIQPGSILRGNHIHDVPRNSGRAESNGMFLDEGTTGFIVEGNAIHDTDRSSIRFHRATTNTVRGNVLLTPPDVPPFRYNSTD